ncbi:spermidine/putrescine transport system ATP-binding protein [Rhodoligotrophos appendicifer]|uniref:ABC transporter ATP-binding protein n=1 Tax=Rhodoligotrophos appendicifer TaxID=987056 RepID=UPI0011850917|nr:ABC transporter ATP-binding protein [Rhodoligotrophos appendicifer]
MGLSSAVQDEGPVIEFRRASKRFGEVVAVEPMDLVIRKGEFLSLLGPSGCGKTTSLRMIAGFDQPSDGEILIEGMRVNGVPAHKRPVNMVFQHYALFPHLDVGRNVAYGLKQRSPRPSAAEIASRVTQTLAMVRLSGFEHRRVWELSGGQQQRVALARALINQPRVLLLDEPLAALDRKLRHDMQIELQNLQRDLDITFVLVTHDQEEALSMSHRVCVMREGRIVQIGSPQELYDRPVSRYVADFVGKSNFFEGRAQARTGDLVDVLLAGDKRVSARDFGREPVAVGNRIAVSIRPEQMILVRDPAGLPDGTAVAADALVLNRIFLGEHTEYLVRAEHLGEFLVMTPRQVEQVERPFDVGDRVAVGWRPGAALILQLNS